MLQNALRILGSLLTLPSDLPYKEIILIFSVAIFSWEKYLSLRQLNQYKKTQPPALLKKDVDEKEFKKSQLYGYDKAIFGIVKSVFDFAQSCVILKYDLVAWAWTFAGWIMVKYIGLDPSYEIVHSLIFVCVTGLVSTVISVPFDLYHNFVLEEKHGFNKMTLKLYVIDFFKQLVISSIIGVPTLAAVLWIIRKMGGYWWMYLSGFILVLQLFLLTIYPTFIQPLFNTLTPVTDGKLKSGIENLAQRVGFPLKKLYVIDGSKRSNHSNAYFYGFGKNKHIVLFDTLIEQLELPEILAIVGHELGHYKLNHLPRMILLSQFQTGFTFYMFSHFVSNKNLYRSFGFGDRILDFTSSTFVPPHNPVIDVATSKSIGFLNPDYGYPVLVGLLLFMNLVGPLSAFLSFLNNVISRRHEFQADTFGVQLGYQRELKQGLIKTVTKNLGSLWVDPMYSAFYYSHPPLLERLKAIGDDVSIHNTTKTKVNSDNSNDQSKKGK